MRILLVNKYHFHAGGAERYIFNLAQLLEKYGHQVAHLAMHHPKNYSSRWTDYFVSQVDLKKPSRTGTLKTISRLFYSQEAKDKIRQLIQAFRPDILHYHNIYGHISPAILQVAHQANIPIVQTVHDYHLIHPNPVMFHHGHVCTITQKHSWSSMFHRCLSDSFIYNLPPTLAHAIHRQLRLYTKYTDLHLVPSRFMNDKLTEYGLKPNQLKVVPNLIHQPIKTPTNSSKSNYVLYAGRLEEHKGIIVLLKAAARLPQIRFKIAGNGTLKDRLTSSPHKNIEYLGHLNTHKLANTISNASFIVLPSLWYENQPYAILESLSYKKPVIASRIGGISEMITSNKNGLLVKPGSINALTNAIQRLWVDQQLRQNLVTNSKKTLQIYLPNNHYQNIISIYQDLTQTI